MGIFLIPRSVLQRAEKRNLWIGQSYAVSGYSKVKRWKLLAKQPLKVFERFEFYYHRAGRWNVNWFFQVERGVKTGGLSIEDISHDESGGEEIEEYKIKVAMPGASGVSLLARHERAPRILLSSLAFGAVLLCGSCEPRGFARVVWRCGYILSRPPRTRRRLRLW